MSILDRFRKSTKLDKRSFIEQNLFLLEQNDKIIIIVPDSFSMSEINRYGERLKGFLKKDGNGILLIRERNISIFKEGTEVFKWWKLKLSKTNKLK